MRVSSSQFILLFQFVTTGVAVLARAMPEQLAVHHPNFVALLYFLRWTNVVELILEDSEGRSKSPECCSRLMCSESRFERDDEDAADWRSRVVV